MKRYRLQNLADVREGHFLQGIVEGEFLRDGGLSFKRPGFRTHDHDGAGGSDTHVHTDCEVFVILQGKAVMEIEGVRHPLITGDVMVVEPGEDHHLLADPDDPCVNLWFHAGPGRHPDHSS
jgi:mannose-6-phosphate isomerase-like protein (cupin superfamily)